MQASEKLLARLEHFGMRLGLERVERLLDALGEPHLAAPSVLVAGTNGKGSTAALLASMCRAAGYRTGLYTSPHLESVTERLAVDGEAIDDGRLAGTLEHVLGAAEELAGEGLAGEPPTYFEALTLAAFLHFRDAAVDLAILEVGLGGRLDATNAAAPELSIVTAISRDHERHLGTSLESIAAEKGAVLRRDRPAVAWSEDPDVRRVLSRQATEVGAHLTFADPAAVSTSTPAVACPQEVALRTERGTYELELLLPGRHQLANLSLAVRAAEILAGRGWPELTIGAIARGVAGCRWPGRLEWVELGGGRRVLLDAAHNAAGIEALADFVERLPGRRPHLLFGALEEKSIDGVLPRLAAACDRVVLTRPPGERAAAPERWSRHFTSRPTRVARDPERALDDALASCRGTLLVCGSIFLVGPVRELLRRRFGVPAAAP